MPELITRNLEEFEDLAVRMAHDRDALAAIRGKLWDQRLECPLFDIERYVRHLESGFELMWDNHLSGKLPRDIDIPRMPTH